MTPDRRLRLDERPDRRVLLVWLAMSAILLLVAAQRLLQGQFPDPDDTLRLVQVRDLIAGQGWFDPDQYRIDPPRGTPMHWSRLVDVPLAGLILLLTPLLGQAAAESVAVVAVPLLTLGATLWVVGRLAWRLMGQRVAIYACLACGFMPALLYQFQPMRIDHHGWQIFTVALALWAISWRQPLHGGAVAGLAMAAGMAISIEVLPMAAAFAGVLFLRWLRDRYEHRWLAAYMQALAFGLAALIALTRGFGDLAQYCDAISPAHIGLFLLAALGTSIAAGRAHASRIGLFAMFGATGALALGFFALSAPACLASPFSALDPLVREVWYVNVVEGQPIWKQDWSNSIPAMVQMTVALLATLALRARSHDWIRRWWSDYALLLLAAIVLSLFVWRSLAFAAVIAALPLGWLMGEMLSRFRGDSPPLVRIGFAAALVVLLVPSAPIMATASVMPEEQARSPVVAKVAESNCRIRDEAGRLNALPRGTIFAPLDIGPAILLKTDHAVVATGHHRANAAMADVIRAFTSSPEIARAIVAAYGADYLVLCTDLGEPRLLAHRAPEGLAAQLLGGEAPGWLESIVHDGPREFAIYRVKS